MSSKCSNVKCPKGKICNPDSGRCVLRDGVVGKKLLEKQSSRRSRSKSPGKKPCKTECPPEKICNPESGKCVLRDGVVGRRILGESKPKKEKSEKVSKRSKKGQCKSNQRLVNGECVCINPNTVMNPITKNCVSAKGAIGKKIIAGKVCPKGEIWDEKLKQCVPQGRDDTASKKLGKLEFDVRLRRDDSTTNFYPYPPKECLVASAAKLTPTQALAVDYSSVKSSLLLVFETGMGKTLTALAAGMCWLQQAPTSKVVIITQKSLLGTFDKEFAKYGTEPDRRFKAYTYDELYNSYTVKGKKPITAEDAMVIFDEVHTVRSYRSVKFAACMKLVHNARKVLLLTATPFVNSLCDFIPIINLLWRAYVIIPKKKKLSDEDAKLPIFNKKMQFPLLSVELPDCGKSIKQLEEEGGLAQQLKLIETLLRGRVAYAQKKTGVNTDYPTPEIITELIPMNPAFEKIFLQDVSDMSDAFANPALFANGFRRAVNKAGGAAFSDKIKRAIEIVKSDNSEYAKNVIFSNWIEYGVDILRVQLKKAGIPYEVIEGDTSAKDRQEYVARFNDLNSGLNTLVITNAGSTGIDLRGVQNIIVLDPVWNNAMLDQIKGRGVRYKSHLHLPADRQRVKIYLLQLVERAFLEGKIKKSSSGDYLLYEIIKRKEGVEKAVSKMLQNISITNIYAAHLPDYA